MAEISIFNLPPTALLRLLHIMCPFHIYCLYKACEESIKLQTMVKEFASSNYQLRINFGKHICFYFVRVKSLEFKGTLCYVKYREILTKSVHRQRKFIESGECILIYGTDMLELSKRVYNGILERFSMQPQNVTIDFTTQGLDYQGLVQWINEIKVRQVHLPTGSNVQDAQYSYLLKHLRCESLYSAVKQSETFEQNRFPICHQKVQFWHSQWIKLDHILKSKCVEISLSFHLLTDGDLNTLLKRVIDGSYSKLEILYLLCDRELNWNEILKDIRVYNTDSRNYETEERFNRQGTRYQIVLDNGKRCLIIPGMLTKGEKQHGFELLQSNHWIFKPLRLLRFPYVILMQILKSSEPGDIFALTQCSERMKNVVKTYIQIIDYSLEVIVATHVYFVVTRYSLKTEFVVVKKIGSEENVNRTSYKRIGDAQNVTITRKLRKDNKINCGTYWSDSIYGCTQLYNALCEVFKFNKIKGRFATNEQDQEFQTANNWIYKTLPKLTSLQLIPTNKEIDDRSMSSILNNINSSFVRVALKPSQRFRAHSLHESVQHWYIKFGHWITLKCFMNLTCVTISVDACKLSDLQLNQLLKHLFVQRNQLEFMWLRFGRNIREDRILEDVQVTPVTEIREMTAFGTRFSNEGGSDVTLDNRSQWSVKFSPTSMKIFYWNN